MSANIDKIPLNEFNRFYLRYNRGEWNGLRFGQAFLNTYFPSVADPEVFYCTDRTSAYEKIFNKYVIGAA